jgi:hypothetical protein
MAIVIKKPEGRQPSMAQGPWLKDGLVDEAIAPFKEVLQFKPDDPDAKERLRALGVPVPG